MEREKFIAAVKDGKLFSVEFTKRDGTNRKMTARLGVKPKSEGRARTWKDEDYDIVTVFDVKKRDYRAVRMEALKKFKHHGRVVKFGAKK